MQSVCGVYGEWELCVCVCVCQSSSVLCVSENRVPWFQGAVSHSRVPPLSAASLRDVLGSLILSIVGGILPRSLCPLAPSARCVSPPPLTPSPCPPLLTACAQNTPWSSGDSQGISAGPVLGKFSMRNITHDVLVYKSY